MQLRWLVLFVQTLGQVPRSTASPTSASSSPSSSSGPILGSPDDAVWYDWGWYGLHPEQHYESFGASPPRPYLLQHDERCSSTVGNNNDSAEGQDLLFGAPRGLAVTTPGPIVYDTRGHLVWMDTHWGEAMDVKVQRYRGADYLTFWHGTDNGTFGEGQYYMLNASYDVVHTVRPAATADGTQLLGDLHDFVITEEGTALMTIYQTMPHDLTKGYGIPTGWIFDSLFQEVGIATGRLVFQWRASDHFAVHDTFAPLRRGVGRHAARAFDFFHINSVAKTPAGDYILSSRYMCAVVCISGTTGDVLWQLGGRHNSFEDLSDGQATILHWQHHAVWHEAAQELTVFDNGAYDKLETAAYSRGMRVHLGLNSTPPTAELVQAYVAPQRLLAQSQGSVQLLPATDTATDTVLVGWGHIPAYTEFDAADGTPLCDVHLCPLGFAALGWCKNYRTAKHHWVGRPSTLPAVVMRPAEHAVYVSWNGATEVRSWQLQTTAAGDKSAFTNHWSAVTKDAFEGRLAVPSTAQTVRVAALDRKGQVLAYSEAVSTTETTVVAAMPAPPPKETLRGHLYRIALYVALGVVGGCVLVYLVLVRYRAVVLTQARHAVAAVVAVASRVLPTRRSYRYEALQAARPAMAEVPRDSR